MPTVGAWVFMEIGVIGTGVANGSAVSVGKVVGTGESVGRVGEQAATTANTNRTRINLFATIGFTAISFVRLHLHDLF